MTEEKRILVQYRLERADETLKEAKLLIKGNHANAFVNRLYYACFYAVNALLLANSLSSVKHSGVRSLFHKNFTKPGKVKIENAKLYDRLFDTRQKADYADLVMLKVEEVRDWYAEAVSFIEEIKSLISL